MRSPQFAGSAARLLSQPVLRDRQAPGAFVTVLHFDHLFHSGWRNTFQPFTVRSPRQIRSRAERVLALLHRLSQSLALEPDLLEHASLPAAALSKPGPPIETPADRLSTGACRQPGTGEVPRSCRAGITSDGQLRTFTVHCPRPAADRTPVGRSRTSVGG
jgi:hypothetical protein